MNTSSVVVSPIASIITAVKNGEKYLAESINSILDQTFINFELIIIDDYSTDTTAKILSRLASLDSRIRIVSNEGLPGLSNALNLGIKIARGDYIVRHDADDISKSNRLEVQIEYLQKHSEIDILGSNIEMVGESGEFLKTHREPLSHAGIAFHTLFGTPFAHPSIVIRKSFLDRCELNYLDVPAQDYELWVRMINAGAKAANIPECLVSYRVTPGSDSNTRAIRHHQMAEGIKLQQILQYLKFPNQIKMVTSSTFQSTAHYLITGNEFKFGPDSRKVAKRVIAFFLEISSQLHVSEKDQRELVTIMKGRLDAISDTSLSLARFRRLGRYIYRLIKRVNTDGVKPRIDLTADEIQAFIENIHVFIIVRDRLSCLKTLVDWLVKAGHRNIVLIDNSSTYPPLLEFLSTTQCKVIRLRENLGHTALWQLTELKEIISANWFVYTDPDVIPDEDCPLDAVGKFYNILLNKPEFVKAGFGLRIDDIPECYHLKDQVVKWESQYYQRPIESGLFNADIDTTFALYRPGTRYCFGPALRTADKYKARHLPWYLNTSDLNDEEVYYRMHALPSVTTWNVPGEVKPLPLPTTWAKFKREVLVIASLNSFSYSFAIKTKRLLDKFKK